jgi:hypothetical protein
MVKIMEVSVVKLAVGWFFDSCCAPTTNASYATGYSSGRVHHGLRLAENVITRKNLAYRFFSSLLPKT